LAWTWFVSGGVARGEAIPGSDVEILIVLDDDVDEAGKTEMLALAADVHTLLERCGLNADDDDQPLPVLPQARKLGRVDRALVCRTRRRPRRGDDVPARRCDRCAGPGERRR
jgi:Putative nucleotidyltransferase DUF294